MDKATIVLAVPEYVGISNVTKVMDALIADYHARRKVQPDARSVTVDLAGLKDFDSTMLSMLLELGRRAGKPLAVVNPPAKLKALAELYGVADLLLASAPEPGHVTA